MNDRLAKLGVSTARTGSLLPMLRVPAPAACRPCGRRSSRIAGGLGLCALLLAFGSGGVPASEPATGQGDRGLIREENQKPGATDWQLTRVRADRGRYRSPWIEGYCSKQSAKAGET